VGRGNIIEKSKLMVKMIVYKYIEIYWKEEVVMYNWNIPSVSYSGTYVIDWLLQTC
jgi:hypothetical protein